MPVLLLLALLLLGTGTLAQPESPSSSFTWSPLCYEAYEPLLTSSCAALQPGAAFAANNRTIAAQQTNLRQVLTDLFANCLQDITSINKTWYLLSPNLAFTQFFLPGALSLAAANSSDGNVSTIPVMFQDWGNDLSDMAAAGNLTILPPASPPPPAPPASISPSPSAVSSITNSTAVSRSNVTLQGLLIDPIALAGLNQQSLLLNIGPLVESDTTLDWNGVHPYYRSTVITQNGLISAVPLGGLVFQLYYRFDILSRFNLSVPRTWDELIRAASITNGTDMSLDGKPDAGICLQRKSSCFAGFSLAAIWTSFVQSKGTAQGAFFDPITMQPLLNNPGMQRAMEIYLELIKYGHPSDPTSCSPIHAAFLSGQCAFTIGWVGQFKADSLLGHPLVRKFAKASLMPGTTEVLNRDTWALESCTAQLCPISTEQAPDRGGVMRPLNRAPFFAVGSISAGISARAPAAAQKALYRVFATLGSSNYSWKVITHPLSELGPYRMEHFDQANIGRWTAAGYDAELTTDFLSTVLATLNHPNTVLEVRIPRGDDYRIIFNQVTDNLQMGNWSVATAMQNFQDMISSSYSPNSSDFNVIRKSYWFSIGYIPPPPPSPPPSPSPPSPPGVPGYAASTAGEKTLKSGQLAAAVVVPVVFVAILLTVCLVISLPGNKYQAAMDSDLRGSKGRRLIHMISSMRHNINRKRALARGGPLKPPGKGEGTTLVVTDVERSTELWEILDANVMDVVWNLHHGCMRKCALRNAGYESQTEGDSFILGFASADEAVSFCLETQRALLELEWPPELLAHPFCAPVWAKPTSDAAAAAVAASQPAPLGAKPSVAVPRRTGTGAVIGELSAAASAVAGASGSLSGADGKDAGAGPRPILSRLSLTFASRPPSLGGLGRSASTRYNVGSSIMASLGNRMSVSHHHLKMAAAVDAAAYGGGSSPGRVTDENPGSGSGKGGSAARLHKQLTRGSSQELSDRGTHAPLISSGGSQTGPHYTTMMSQPGRRAVSREELQTQHTGDLQQYKGDGYSGAERSSRTAGATSVLRSWNGRASQPHPTTTGERRGTFTGTSIAVSNTAVSGGGGMVAVVPSGPSGTLTSPALRSRLSGVSTVATAPSAATGGSGGTGGAAFSSQTSNVISLLPPPVLPSELQGVQSLGRPGSPARSPALLPSPSKGSSKGRGSPRRGASGIPPRAPSPAAPVVVHQYLPSGQGSAGNRGAQTGSEDGGAGGQFSLLQQGHSVPEEAGDMAPALSFSGQPSATLRTTAGSLTLPGVSGLFASSLDSPAPMSPALHETLGITRSTNQPSAGNSPPPGAASAPAGGFLQQTRRSSPIFQPSSQTQQPLMAGGFSNYQYTASAVVQVSAMGLVQTGSVTSDDQASSQARSSALPGITGNTASFMKGATVISDAAQSAGPSFAAANSDSTASFLKTSFGPGNYGFRGQQTSGFSDTSFQAAGHAVGIAPSVLRCNHSITAPVSPWISNSGTAPASQLGTLYSEAVLQQPAGDYEGGSMHGVHAPSAITLAGGLYPNSQAPITSMPALVSEDGQDRPTGISQSHAHPLFPASLMANFDAEDMLGDFDMAPKTKPRFALQRMSHDLGLDQEPSPVSPERLQGAGGMAALTEIQPDQDPDQEDGVGPALPPGSQGPLQRLIGAVFGTGLVESWAMVEPGQAPPPGSVLMWRGLRVRMGASSGLTADTDLIYSEVAARIKYTGAILDAAKGVSNAAHGGDTVVAASCATQLSQPFITNKRQQIFMLWMGKYTYEGKDHQHVSLYRIFNRFTIPRICQMRPLRANPAVPGTLSAPIHVVSHVLLVLCARRALLAEGGPVCEEVMRTLRLTVSRCAAHHKGYLPKVEQILQGEALAVFSSTVSAIAWALEVQALMAKHSWSEEVLAHEHCEAITMPDGKGGDTIVSQGPRVKAVIVWGSVRWAFSPMTGRLVYTGSLIDQAHDLLHQATAGMVVAAPAAAYAAFLEAASALHEGDVAMALNTAGAQAVNSANHSSTTARFSMGLPITDDGSASDDPYDDEEEEEEGNEGQHHGHVREAMQGSSHHEGSKDLPEQLPLPAAGPSEPILASQRRKQESLHANVPELQNSPSRRSLDERPNAGRLLLNLRTGNMSAAQMAGDPGTSPPAGHSPAAHRRASAHYPHPSSPADLESFSPGHPPAHVCDGLTVLSHLRGPVGSAPGSRMGSMTGRAVPMSDIPEGSSGQGDIMATHGSITDAESAAAVVALQQARTATAAGASPQPWHASAVQGLKHASSITSSPGAPAGVAAVQTGPYPANKRRSASMSTVSPRGASVQPSSPLRIPGAGQGVLGSTSNPGGQHPAPGEASVAPAVLPTSPIPGSPLSRLASSRAGSFTVASIMRSRESSFSAKDHHHVHFAARPVAAAPVQYQSSLRRAFGGQPAQVDAAGDRAPSQPQAQVPRQRSVRSRVSFDQTPPSICGSQRHGSVGGGTSSDAMAAYGIGPGSAPPASPSTGTSAALSRRSSIHRSGSDNALPKLEEATGQPQEEEAVMGMEQAGVQGYPTQSLGWANSVNATLLPSPRGQLASQGQSKQGSFLFESKDSFSAGVPTLAPSAGGVSAAPTTIPSSGNALPSNGSPKAKGGPVCIDCAAAFLADWGLAPMLVQTVLPPRRGGGKSGHASASQAAFSGDPASRARMPVGPPAEVFLCSLADPAKVNSDWLLSNQLDRLQVFARALRAAQRQGRMGTKSGKLAAWRKGLHSILGAAMNPTAAAQRNNNFMVGAGPSLEHVLEGASTTIPLGIVGGNASGTGGNSEETGGLPALMYSISQRRSRPRSSIQGQPSIGADSIHGGSNRLQNVDSNNSHLLPTRSGVKARPSRTSLIEGLLGGRPSSMGSTAHGGSHFNSHAGSPRSTAGPPSQGTLNALAGAVGNTATKFAASLAASIGRRPTDASLPGDEELMAPAAATAATDKAGKRAGKSKPGKQRTFNAAGAYVSGLRYASMTAGSPSAMLQRSGVSMSGIATSRSVHHDVSARQSGVSFSGAAPPGRSGAAAAGGGALSGLAQSVLRRTLFDVQGPDEMVVQRSVKSTSHVTWSHYLNVDQGAPVSGGNTQHGAGFSRKPSTLDGGTADGTLGASRSGGITGSTNLQTRRSVTYSEVPIDVRTSNSNSQLHVMNGRNSVGTHQGTHSTALPSGSTHVSAALPDALDAAHIITAYASAGSDTPQGAPKAVVPPAASVAVGHAANFFSLDRAAMGAGAMGWGGAAGEEDQGAPYARVSPMGVTHAPHSHTHTSSAPSNVISTPFAMPVLPLGFSGRMKNSSQPMLMTITDNASAEMQISSEGKLTPIGIAAAASAAVTSSGDDLVASLSPGKQAEHVGAAASAAEMGEAQVAAGEVAPHSPRAGDAERPSRPSTAGRASGGRMSLGGRVWPLNNK